LIRKNQFLLIVTVVANGFNRASFHGLFAERSLIVGLRLLIEVSVTTVFVPRKVVRRSFTTKVAVNALIIDEIFAFYVVVVSIFVFCHFFEGVLRPFITGKIEAFVVGAKNFCSGNLKASHGNFFSFSVS